MGESKFDEVAGEIMALAEIISWGDMSSRDFCLQVSQLVCAIPTEAWNEDSTPAVTGEGGE